MITLISVDFSQPVIQELLNSYVSTYKGAHLEIAQQVIHCCLKLRPICSTYHKNVVEVILNKASEDAAAVEEASTFSSSSSSSSSSAAVASTPVKQTCSKEIASPSLLVDLQTDLLCKVFAPELLNVSDSRPENGRSNERTPGTKNDAKYLQKQLDQANKTSSSNPFRLAVEKTRFSIMGQKEKKRSVMQLRQALGLNYGRSAGGAR